MKPSPFIVSRTGMEIVVSAESEVIRDLVEVLQLLLDMASEIRAKVVAVEARRNAEVSSRSNEDGKAYLVKCGKILEEYNQALTVVGDRRRALKSVCLAHNESQYLILCALASARKEKKKNELSEQGLQKKPPAGNKKNHRQRIQRRAPSQMPIVRVDDDHHRTAPG